MGMFLNSFIRHANIVKMANLAQLVNVIAPIFTNEQGLFLQTIYLPHRSNTASRRTPLAVDALVTSPTYSRRRPQAARVPRRLHHARSRKHGTVYVNVLNRSEKLDITARIENVDRHSRPRRRCLGDEPPGPEGDPHLRRRRQSPPRHPHHSGSPRKQWLQLHLPQGLADYPQAQGKLSVTTTG